MDLYIYQRVAYYGLGEPYELLRAFFLVMIGRTKTNQAKSYHLSLNLPKYYKQAIKQQLYLPSKY